MCVGTHRQKLIAYRYPSHRSSDYFSRHDEVWNEVRNSRTGRYVNRNDEEMKGSDSRIARFCVSMVRFRLVYVLSHIYHLFKCKRKNYHNTRPFVNSSVLFCHFLWRSSDADQCMISLLYEIATIVRRSLNVKMSLVEGKVIKKGVNRHILCRCDFESVLLNSSYVTQG